MIERDGHDQTVSYAVEISGLRKTVAVGFRRRKVEILKGVDLRVEQGSVFGLLGPNGAGKTTTVKVALGLMRPSSGVVRLGVSGLREVGYLPENPYFYDYLTGREFLDLCARLFSLDAATRDERIETSLDDVGLSDAGAVQLRKYSKGMLQRIGIAQALINDPALVLLDEPMTGLDPIGRAEVKEIITRLGRRGKTVLFNSHVLSDVAALCSHLAVMRAGQIVWCGSIGEALQGHPDDLEGFFLEVVGS